MNFSLSAPRRETFLVSAIITILVVIGMIVPLPLFPDWLQHILAYLPFAGVVDLPFRVYNGNIPASDVAFVLARQLGWTLLLVAIGRWMLSRGMRRIVVQGG